VSRIDITRSRKSRDAKDPPQSQACTSEKCDYLVIFDLSRIEVLAPSREYHVPRFLKCRQRRCASAITSYSVKKLRRRCEGNCRVMQTLFFCLTYFYMLRTFPFYLQLAGKESSSSESSETGVLQLSVLSFFFYF